MEIAGLIIALIAVVAVIALNSKLNKIDSATSAKHRGLEQENQKLLSTIDEQNRIIEQLQKSLNDTLGQLVWGCQVKCVSSILPLVS